MTVDPGAARGSQTYPPSRGRCTCSHVEAAHELCGCRVYEEVDCG